MFFKKANILFAGFTILTLSTLGGIETGYASELKIEEENVLTLEFTPYYRSFIVTSTVNPALYKTPSIVVPEMKWPTDTNVLSSGYGHRESCSRCSSFHEGADFTPGEGRSVYASMDGIISKIENRGEYGLYIIMEHIAVINEDVEKWETVYAHLKLDSIPGNITVGSLVEAGTVIGSVGRTGLTTGPHLHFELRVFGEKKDPYKYLKMYAD